MSFYNKKQEVIDIQLTQYGKIALSQGKFRPYSYGFFDDDIIYDAAYAGITEEQNDSQDRILTFARKKPALSIYGSETKINETSLSGGQKDGTKQINANDVDSRLLLRDRLVTYPATTQMMPDFKIRVSSNNAKLDKDSLSNTTASYANTATEQVQMVIKAYESAPHPATGIQHINVSPTMITFYESLDFCKDEEFEIRLYEVEKTPSVQDETKLVEKITNLYYSSGDRQHARINDRFIISVDENVENQEAITRNKKDCDNSFKLSTKPQQQSQTVMRDLYAGLEDQKHDCED